MSDAPTGTDERRPVVTPVAVRAVPAETTGTDDRRPLPLTVVPVGEPGRRDG